MNIKVGIIERGKTKVYKLIINEEDVAYSKHDKVIELYMRYIKGEEIEFPIADKAEKVLKPYREQYLKEGES